MAPEQDVKRTGRKLVKKRKTQRNSSVQYPERLKYKEGEDVHEDVTASKGQLPQHLNQSVFSMIAAAGSKVDFHARFEEGTSDSEENDNVFDTDREHANTFPEEYTDKEGDPSSAAAQRQKQPHGKLPADRTGQPRPKLSLQTIKERNYMSQSSQLPPEEFISPISSPSSMTPRDAPVMSMMLRAEAQLDSSDPLSHPRIEESGMPGGRAKHSSLAIRLKEIFGFEEPEEVISGMWEGERSFSKSLLIIS
jgi:sterol 3beta-glucosyltransferase